MCTVCRQRHFTNGRFQETNSNKSMSALGTQRPFCPEPRNFRNGRHQPQQLIHTHLDALGNLIRRMPDHCLSRNQALPRIPLAEFYFG